MTSPAPPSSDFASRPPNRTSSCGPARRSACGRSGPTTRRPIEGLHAGSLAAEPLLPVPRRPGRVARRAGRLDLRGRRVEPGRPRGRVARPDRRGGRLLRRSPAARAGGGGLRRRGRRPGTGPRDAPARAPRRDRARARHRGVRRRRALGEPPDARRLPATAASRSNSGSTRASSASPSPSSVTPAFEERAAVRSSSAAAAASMKKLFEPRSVAVVGASRHRGKIGFEILHNLIADALPRSGVSRQSRTARRIAGRRCYASVAGHSRAASTSR